MPGSAAQTCLQPRRQANNNIVGANSQNELLIGRGVANPRKAVGEVGAGRGDQDDAEEQGAKGEVGDD